MSKDYVHQDASQRYLRLLNDFCAVLREDGLVLPPGSLVSVVVTTRVGESVGSTEFSKSGGGLAETLAHVGALSRASAHAAVAELAPREV